MTLIQLLQDFCSKWGLPAPSAIVASTDATYKQLLSLAKESVRDLQKKPWTRSKHRITWTMVATEDQGTVETVFGADFRGLVSASVWNTTQNVPIFGPVGDQSWQLYKEFSHNPWSQYKIMDGHFLLLPAPTAGHVMSAIITSRYLVANAGNSKEYYTADDDTLVLGDEIFLKDLEWRWLKQKGEAWQAAKDEADQAIASALVADGGLPTLSLDGGRSGGLRPGIVVPEGSWLQ